MEDWVDLLPILGINYRVSQLGRVQNTTTGKLVFGATNGSGYRTISAKIIKENRGTVFMIHRLVAIAFIPNPENKPQVNHLDGNKQNNRVENLAWATASENVAHSHKIGLCRVGERHYKAKLTEADVLEIRRRYYAGEASQNAIAHELGMDSSTISDLVQGKTWKHLPFQARPVSESKNFRGCMNPNAKLHEGIVRQIKRDLSSGKYLQTELVKKYRVSKNTISQISLGKLWAHVA